MNQDILNLHKNGKIIIENKFKLDNKETLAMAYTPGVAEVVNEIAKNPSKFKELTIVGNTVGMFTDGTAVLGLGNLGSKPAMPVMEGKAMIYRDFAGINAIPLLLNTTDVDKIVDTIVNISSSFSLIHLEDISAPNCFEIFDKLTERLDIPVFHDDQYGTAIVVLAGLINALKVTNKSMDTSSILINGAGAAGLAIAKLLYFFGFKDITLCDSKGVMHNKRPDLNKYKKEVISLINNNLEEKSLKEALINKDIFIGVSKGKLLTNEMIKTMNNNPIIFALANPEPEIIPSELDNYFQGVIATGRSDFPNQINNAIGYPGFVKAILDNKIKTITNEHFIQAAKGIAKVIEYEELTKDYIIPDVFNSKVLDSILSNF
jgi:malate dehydrogenase (oxaloacetate-decarboxylating)